VAIVALAVANTPVQVASKVQAEAMFGVGSMLSAMVAAARVADPFGLFYCLPLADAGGAVAATGTITVSTPPTAAGSIPLYIGDKKVSVAGIETVAQTATAIANAINAQSDLPVMSAAAAGVVTLTARN
jgi:phage tail sheath gpL-like